MKNMSFLLVLLLSSFIVAGCGKDEGGKPSAKSQLDNLQPADVSNPAVLADATGNAIAMSQSGLGFSGGFGMGMMKALRIPVLKGSRLQILQQGNQYNCTGDQSHFTCTYQCQYGGSIVLECSGSETSGTCKETFKDCKEESDEPAANGYLQWDAKQGSGGSVSFKVSIDLTAGQGFIYGSYDITLTQSGTSATIRQILDISGADNSDPTDVGYIYFDETISMQDLGNYEFKATVNGEGAFGTTKKGKVSIAINNVVIDPSICWMEPVSGTITVSAGSSSVTVTFDGASACDGKAQCSGAYDGEIDITESSEPIF